MALATRPRDAARPRLATITGSAAGMPDVRVDTTAPTVVTEQADSRDAAVRQFSLREIGGVWWWIVPFFLIFAAEELIPGIPGPASRDFATFMENNGKEFFRGAWGWFTLVVVLGVFNTILGEELLFRGVLLPRMRGVFGRR